MSSRYFLDEATKLGWFLLPADRRQEWLDLMQRWDRNEPILEEIDAAFGYWRVIGEPSDWTLPTR